MTQKTKELHKKIKRVALFAGVLFFTAFSTRYNNAYEAPVIANAATLQLHNYVTDDTYDYTGAQVSYNVNGKALDFAYPGLILDDGSAVGPCDEIFVDILGVTSDYSDGKSSFNLKYGSTTIQMTLGYTKAYVNGTLQTMPNAPFVYSFNGSLEKYLYVPTRFVAQNLGFDYTWDSTTSTSSITKPTTVYDGKEAIKYTGITPKLYLNNVQMKNDSFPGYVFSNTFLFSAEHYFKQPGLASYSYSEGSGLIAFEKGDVQVRLVLDSPVAYINDTPHLLKTVPRLITPAGSAEAVVYVPALFVANALGYDTKSTNSSLYITGTVDSSANQIQPEQTLLPGTIVPDTASYGAVLFSSKALEQVVEHYTALGYQVPSEISAYSCLNSDALYLKGIEHDSIEITDKQDVIEIVVENCHNPFSAEYHYNPTNAFLNYYYVFGTDRLRIIIIKTKDLQCYSYGAPDGTVVHFTDRDGMYQDYLQFTGIPDVSEDTGLAGSEITAELPEAVFSRDYFVIPLPEGITFSDVSDIDEYANKRFKICISGNHMAFLSEQEVYNPTSTLKNYQVNYKLADDTTILTFNTTKIQGYSYMISGGFLAVKIADPPEIYDKIVVLDAGHGGIDPGTLRGSVYEKTVNFNVVNVYAPEYFEDSDIKVYYTRTTDTKISLDDRAAFAKSVGADFFISFHVNAHSNAAVNGTSVYYSASNNKPNAAGLKSSVLASNVLNHLREQWGTKNQGVLTAKFVVIHNNTVPAVLVECGFITNNDDFSKIKDATYQRKAAKALFDSVSEIFEQYPTGR